MNLTSPALFLSISLDETTEQHQIVVRDKAKQVPIEKLLVWDFSQKSAWEQSPSEYLWCFCSLGELLRFSMQSFSRYVTVYSEENIYLTMYNEEEST